MNPVKDLPIAADESVRRVAFRTVGNTHGPVTRLMSPSDLGHMLKPWGGCGHGAIVPFPATALLPGGVTRR